MSSLLDACQPLPPADCLTVMEKDGEMKFLESAAPVTACDQYPDVRVSVDQTRASSQRENIKSAFIPAHRTVCQRARMAWLEQGYSDALAEIVNSKEEVHPVVATGAACLLAGVRAFNSFSTAVFPHMSLSNEELVVKFAEVADWHESPVRAFAWHPHTTKFALALQDNSVHVHYSASTLVPVLKHKLQKSVAHLAWQPLSASVLAVACHSAVLIWHIEPTSLAARPSSSSVQVLQHSGHSPVTHLAWLPSANILLSASPVDTAVMAWSVGGEACTALRYLGGGGVSLLTCSPDGSKVLAATPTTLFRVWDTTNWHCEVWSQLSGRLTSACWSRDGQVVVFSMEGDAGLHAVNFGSHTPSLDRLAPGKVSHGPGVARVVADWSEVTLTSHDGAKVKTGGDVHQMAWSPTSERLAVMFKGQDGSLCPLVAVFKTSVHPSVQVLPSGFVKGHQGESPVHISFQPSFDRGALLTVVWSSGRVGYIPMYFVAEEKIGSFQVQTSVMNGHSNRQLYTDLM